VLVDLVEVLRDVRARHIFRGQLTNGLRDTALLLDVGLRDLLGLVGLLDLDSGGGGGSDSRDVGVLGGHSTAPM
jgi:hypothetical protein